VPQLVRTFRIFVSSPFRDLKREREALQRFVFPRRRDLCRGAVSGDRFTLGGAYGRRPLPSAIPEEEYGRWRRARPTPASCVVSWYRRDEIRVPPCTRAAPPVRRYSDQGLCAGGELPL
jgi:hypothetical protein